MPLSRAEFELLREDKATQQAVQAVHAFLKVNPRLAYTPEEVADAVHQEVHLVAHILEKFDDLYLVESGSGDDQRYFRYLADLPDIN